MTRKSAMKIRMDLAMPMNPADLSEVLGTAEKIKALKDAATEFGFTLTCVIAKVGTVAVDDAVMPGVEAE